MIAFLGAHWRWWTLLLVLLVGGLAYVAFATPQRVEPQRAHFWVVDAGGSPTAYFCDADPAGPLEREGRALAYRTRADVADAWPGLGLANFCPDGDEGP